MVLDEPTKRAWAERLGRKNPDDCLKFIEIGEITFQAGQKREVYVGGVFNNLLWYSFDMDERRNLVPSIQRLPLDYIADYRKVS